MNLATTQQSRQTRMALDFLALPPTLLRLADEVIE